MDRRTFVVNGALTAVAGAALAGRSALSQTIAVTVRGPRDMPPIPPNFLGLGYEIASVGRPGLLSPLNFSYVQMVRTLGSHGVIRVGGNTADYATFAPQAAAVSSPYKTVVNDAVLERLGGFLGATGWQLIWALNLGSGSVEDAIAEAGAVLHIAGTKLLAFEIGNEPDIFPGEKHRPRGYRYDDWLAEYRRYKTALRAKFPRIPFAGPDAADNTEWVTRFAADEGKDCVLLTHHYYREGQNPGSTIQKLLGVDPKLQPQLDQLRVASERAGVPYRICEVNSFSGGGRPGVSDTMAAALWALDYLLTLAYNGCAGVNMETGVNQHNFISSYSPVGDDEQGHYEARPEYYGMLAFTICGRGEMLDIAVEGVSSVAHSIKAYATRRGPSTVFCLINKGAVDADIEVNVGMDGNAFAVRLSGPAVDATTGITLGGRQVTATGTREPFQREVVVLRQGQMKIRVPAASAAMVEVVASFAK